MTEDSTTTTDTADAAPDSEAEELDCGRPFSEFQTLIEETYLAKDSARGVAVVCISRRVFNCVPYIASRASASAGSKLLRY